ncbi:type 1 glutamine amidotransferase domain-containing protein [Shimia sp. R10_1]|uniref:type 1 glutamine amidotransferase domain-containing protein n=1 Tax=Shimia sp. R10_1 TaxID=2821095 RepID=UPI001ADC698B|nr:type 1 glutamine amidotransferase domain-containing protein [Shimia sp. R10_1]MBO9473671.1 type 1 glutamine amidotransferase domain-containing protein [Shimia sp. R10_1]
MTKKILVVLTSHDQLGETGEKTGFWLEELAAPYYAFVDAGFELTLASPMGGLPPLDPKSNEPDFQTDDTHRFEADAAANVALNNTAKLADVAAEDFDAIFYPGGHGPMWDLVDDADSINLIEAFFAADKPVSSVCHGPIVLINAKDADGSYIVKDRKVTGFSNSEEEAVGLTNVVPKLLEDALVARGGIYYKGDDWLSYVQKDGNLITGQNPNSSVAVAQEVIRALS